MSNIGLFFGSNTGNTEEVAEKLQELLGDDCVSHNVDSSSKDDFEKYPYLILGTSTWGEGDLQDDWEVFIDELDNVDFSNKKVALFGLGDQESYPDSFTGGMGHLYKKLAQRDISVVGQTSTEGYDFGETPSVVDGKFVGLALDIENQDELTDERLEAWVEELKKHFT